MKLDMLLPLTISLTIMCLAIAFKQFIVGLVHWREHRRNHGLLSKRR